MEALIGYLALDMGYLVMEQFVLHIIYPEINEVSKSPVKSYKTMAQEHIQKFYKHLPVYHDYDEQVDEK